MLTGFPLTGFRPRWVWLSSSGLLASSKAEEGEEEQEEERWLKVPLSAQNVTKLGQRDRCTVGVHGLAFVVGQGRRRRANNQPNRKKTGTSTPLELVLRQGLQPQQKSQRTRSDEVTPNKQAAVLKPRKKASKDSAQWWDQERASHEFHWLST